MNEDEIAKVVVDSSLKVHTLLGPGLLESIYEACLGHELERRGLTARKQVPLSVVYDDLRLDNAFRIDLLVNEKVVIELKAIDKLLPIHTAQLLSYLKLGNYRLGFLPNLNVVHMKDGIKRLVNGLS